jgi:acyl-[acyl-carrier-protein]-phospholipid O-acyltransferase / long-chain-fatty-acid--[acyl-carrier-protein] ligase
MVATPTPRPRRFDAAALNTTLFGALLDTIAEHGAERLALEDVERQPISYGRLVLGSLVLGQALARVTRRSETVGVLLPNVTGLVVVVFGLNAFGRVPALLNFSAGLKNLKSAIATGAIRRVVTSRRFVAMSGLGDTVKALAEMEVAPGKTLQITYLEDVRKAIGLKDKLQGAIRAKFARRFHRKHALAPNQPAVVLFTSGTEGAPKGVVLTNSNLVANARQIFVHADGFLFRDEIVMNPLPLFHSYGLTAGTLMPLLSGMKVVLYPSPLHYKEIPKLIGETKATVLFATDTFLQGYARGANADDLKSVRYVIAGAEKIKDQTRATWAKYGTTILEGYGATECSPVLTCNLPSRTKPGSVGPLLPGIETKLVPVPGIDDGGRLVVRGPNVMAGYLLPDKPGVLVPVRDSWHDTGDIVDIDDAGLVSIKGRAKRFAKIGGEMVSLAAVETIIAGLWPENNSVVLSVPDERRGEQLILVTDRKGADRAQLLAAAKAEGVPELWVPRSIHVVEQIPVLASGKIDFVATSELLAAGRPAGAAVH